VTAPVSGAYGLTSNGGYVSNGKMVMRTMLKLWTIIKNELKNE